jgi:hypothetical protein
LSVGYRRGQRLRVLATGEVVVFDRTEAGTGRVRVRRAGECWLTAFDASAVAPVLAGDPAPQAGQTPHMS